MKIYFSGSIYGGRQKLDTYQILINELKKNNKVLNEEVADVHIIEREIETSDEKIFKNLEKKLKEADLIFAELTIPSLGVGYELAYAENLGKPIYAVYEKNANVSALLRGDKNIHFLPYDNMNQVIDKINEIMK